MTGAKDKTEKEKVKCKHCGGLFTLFLSHLKKKMDCQKAYGKGYERMLDLSNQKKKDYMKVYKAQHKDARNESQREQRNKDKEKTNREQREQRNKDKEIINKNRREQRNKDKEKTNKEQKFYRNKKKMNWTQVERIKAFKRQIIDGPNFTCYSCKRCLFKNQVKTLKADNVKNLKAKLKRKTVTQMGLQFKKNELIFCHNCLKLIQKGKIPKIHYTNGLWLDKVPDELNLKDLEQQLIARSLIFMKVKKLRFGMKAMTDMVISVPIEEDDISKTISAFPRHPDDAKVVAVQLKRKVLWKNTHLQEFIRPAKCIAAVEKLKELGNPFYQDITINENFMDKQEVLT